MSRMELSVKDRLILSNQYRILEAVCPDEKEYFKRSREAIDNGYELEYDMIADHIYDGMSADECREVRDILEMYRRLTSSYNELADKTGIDKHSVKFRGFDGNNETSYLGYHEYLTAQGKWTEFPAENSHARSIEMYRRMLAAWTPMRTKTDLTMDEIIRIVGEQIHPSRRNG